jgi:hypothetical protein
MQPSDPEAALIIDYQLLISVSEAGNAVALSIPVCGFFELRRISYGKQTMV